MHARYMEIALRSCVGRRFLNFAVVAANLGDNGDIEEVGTDVHPELAMDDNGIFTR